MNTLKTTEERRREIRKYVSALQQEFRKVGNHSSAINDVIDLLDDVETLNRWIPVEERLPDRPDNHIEASEDVIAAIIGPEGVERWDRACVCAFGHDGWAKDGISLNWIPTHWRYL